MPASATEIFLLTLHTTTSSPHHPINSSRLSPSSSIAPTIPIAPHHTRAHYSSSELIDTSLSLASDHDHGLGEEEGEEEERGGGDG